MGSSTSVSSRSEDHFSRLLGAARLRAEALLNRPGIHRLRQTDERCSVSERRTARTGRHFIWVESQRCIFIEV